jgi:hypothetical protein
MLMADRPVWNAWRPHLHIGCAPETGAEIGRGYACDVFSNTTTPRVEKAEGMPLLNLALILCLMAAIAALAFVACAAPAGLWADGLFQQNAS